MIRRIEIHNYALIENAELELGSGFTVITGETGSGKSIMLGALSLLLGTRADSKVAVNGKARVSATFEDIDASLRQVFDDHGIEWIENSDESGVLKSEVTIRREISAEGRSRVYINDTSVTLATLGKIGPKLVDIHSQLANSRISNPADRLSMVDAFTGNLELLEDYRKTFREYVILKRKINDLRDRITHNRENEQFMRFQCEQLDRLNPRYGELAEIEKRYEMLSDADDIKLQLTTLCNLLGDSDHGLLSALSEAKAMTEKLNFSLFGHDAVESDIPGRMEILTTELQDISETIEDINASVDTDPATLGKLSERMKMYYDATKYFKVGSADELVDLHSKLKKDLSEISGEDGELPALEKEAHTLAILLKKKADILSQSRKKGASELSNKIWEEAHLLGMPNLKFEIAVDKAKLNSSGQDNIEFLCAFNKNSELRGVTETASGGEMSRLMLSIKGVIAREIKMPTMVFDEVDTGVSGEIAERMGAMMERMGHYMQVIAITHLPQVAAQGSQQFKVYKQDEGDKTVTHIQLLDKESRVREIASMISGSDVSEAAIQNARHLMNK